MSINIIDLVKEQVKGQVIGHMGNLLGDEGGKATSAVDSIIPSLLNGMTGAANSGDGADKLFGAIQDQDDSLLDNMGALLDDGQASTVIENGNSVLTNLFGGEALGKLASAMAGFSGVSTGGTSSLMGVLAPIVLGVLKRRVMDDNLNASGLASMLANQSNNINASLPQGLSDQLNTSGFSSGITDAGAGIAAGAAGIAATGAASLTGGAKDIASNATGAIGDATSSVAGVAGNAGDSVSGAVGNAREGVTNAAGNAGDSVSGAVGNARDGATNAASTASDSVNTSGSKFRWLLPIVALGALGWAAFTFLLPGAKDAATDSTSSVTDLAGGLMDPSEVGGEVSGLFSSASSTLEGITDVDSANAALPALTDLGTKVESVSGMLENLPKAAQGPIGAIAEQGVGKLQPLIDKALEIPGVGDVLSPVIGPIMEKMQGIGG